MVQIDNGYSERGSKTELVWLDTTGKEVRTEQVELLGYVPPTPRQESWKVAGLTPIPAAWGVIELLSGPLAMVNHHKVPTYAAGLRQSWHDSWPACVAVLLFSAALAGVAWRRHQRQHFSHGRLWAIFVFLLGVPGIVAYWIMNPRLAHESCPSCGCEVPRNRERCARCAEPFPEPQPKGIEVFV